MNKYINAEFNKFSEFSGLKGGKVRFSSENVIKLCHSNAELWRAYAPAWIFRVWLKCGRLRWFGHLEHKSEDDWVSACHSSN